jgi:diacylglycerol kinase family enzyme
MGADQRGVRTSPQTLGPRPRCFLKFGISKPEVLKRLTAVSVSLSTYRPRPVDADGELVTKTPAQFELHPKALTVIVPHKRPIDSSS